MVLADADLNGLNLSSTLLGPMLAQAWCWAQSWETLTLPSQGSWGAASTQRPRTIMGQGENSHVQ